MRTRALGVCQSRGTSLMTVEEVETMEAQTVLAMRTEYLLAPTMRPSRQTVVAVAAAAAQVTSTTPVTPPVVAAAAAVASGHHCHWPP